LPAEAGTPNPTQLLRWTQRRHTTHCVKRPVYLLLLLPFLSGCGAIHDEDIRPMESTSIHGALPLELTPELRAAGAIAIAPYGGPWVFRADKLELLREGDFLQVDVIGGAEFNRSYVDFANEEGLWMPEGVRPIKIKDHTQKHVEEVFPGHAGLPQGPGLRIRVFGPYSRDGYVMGGEVKSRGFWPLKEGLTLREAIRQAGGPKREMPAGRIHLVRGDRVVTFLLADVWEGRTQPFLVKPCDGMRVCEEIEMKFDARKLGVPAPPPRE
jgi:hypothetical protein